MGSGSTRLRTKVIALLASLVALWSFAAWVTVRDGFNLLWVQTLDSRVAEPGEPLVTELQTERRLATTYLGQRGQRQRDELTAQWRRTGQVTDTFRTSVHGWQAELATSDDARGRIDAVLTGLDGLDGVRESVAGGRLDRAEASDAYTAVIGALLRMYGSLGRLDDARIAADSATLVDLYQVRELMSQQDALISGVLAAGRMTGDEHARFARLVGAQRYLSAAAVGELPAGDRARYGQLVTTDAFTRFRDLEDRVVQQSRTDAGTPLTGQEWQAAVGPALKAQEDFGVAVGDALIDRATPVAVGVIVRLVLAAGLGLIAVVASIVVSVTTARALVRQLERLRDAALRLADERLPGVVERLGRGERVDVAREVPPLDFGDDEIGQVGRAFNAVQETAVRTAVEQAELRRNVRGVFLSLARRTQALVHRQLTLLDAMERREQDAEELEDLFRVDHLATRMRRNAENLIVLSGATPGRAWRRSVPMVDVVRGAVAEVEDYTRVDVLPLGPISLAGRAVGDVIHLVAELIENGLAFSPPHTTVEVRGQLVANGFVLEIEDRGLGMTAEDLAVANDRIVDRSELNLANASRLGLYVVSRLTERHGVQVRLKESPYGGTTAVVLIPLGLVESGDPSPSGGFPASADAPSTATTGGGRPVDGVGTVPTAPAAGPARPAEGASGVGPARPAEDGFGNGGGSDTGAASPGGAADGDPAEVPALPVRTGTSTSPGPGEEAPSLTPAGLPTRSRTRPGRGALNRPTVPTVPQLAGAAPSPSSTVESAAPDAAPPQARPAVTVSSPDVTVARADGEVVAASPTVEAPVTDAGLPVRVRQASIAPQLRDEPATPDADADEPVRRAPEEVRRMMSAYQSGTRRGRTDAARLLGGVRTGPDTGDGQAT
ncbi:nitrate- and nitrite sensing domain-containing protein [Micromonospora sp. DT47]|uniref:sensor histidine kinase n=1 Tax=Micromonospora sp. DT47 TaxID=3393431 RepID=UPI003CEA4534